MNKTSVVNLGQVRDLAQKWDEVRREILAGRIHGFQLCLIGHGGKETIYLAGVYRDDHRLATRSALKMSAARALAEDDPPQLTGTK